MDFLDSLKNMIKIIGLIFLIILVITVFPIRIIKTGEVGVLLEFGKIKEIWYPGLHVMIPFVNSVESLSIQIQKFETDASAASADLQIVKTTIAVNYRLPQDDSDLKLIYSNFQSEYEERIIAPLTQEAVKSITAKYSAEELITRREELKSVIGTNLKQKLSQYNIQLVEVSITNFDFSPEFNDAIEKKVVAEQNKLQAQFELEKKQIEVRKVIAEKNASAIAAVLEADGEAQSKIIRANADAQAINAITATLTDKYLKYYNAQKWDGQLPKVLGAGQSIIDISTLLPSNKSN